jgi:hypothetical protein
MPDANALTVGTLALTAQHDREAINRRTGEALAAAKRPRDQTRQVATK